MNIAGVKMEMDTMVTNVWKEAEQWQKLVQRGRVTMKQIATVNARIFATENQLNNVDKPRELRSTEKRIQQMFLRLQNPLQIMQKVLDSLAKIKDSTTRMHSRLGLWIDDDHVTKHRIRPHLRAPKLLEVLKFLCQRYDAEWEVKEMVVYHLEHVSNSYDLGILLEAWCNCRHAGGGQFLSKMGEFYDAIGRSRSF
ncbi:hypothetical protein KR067_009325, partial [Drosophila pandora]